MRAAEAEFQVMRRTTGEDNVLPHCVRHERHTLLMRQFVIFLHVCGAADDASRHGPRNIKGRPFQGRLQLL